MPKARSSRERIGVTKKPAKSRMAVSPVKKKKSPPKKVSLSKKIIASQIEPEVADVLIMKMKRKAAEKKASPRDGATHLTITESGADAEKVNISVNYDRNPLKNQLQKLSPFRFPIDQMRVASQVARTSGVAFVVVGAILTMVNFLHVGGVFPSVMLQFAQTTTSSGTYNCSDTTSPNYNLEYCTSSGSNTTTSGTGGSIDSTPSASFTVEGTEPYSNVVPINVIVPYATTVSVQVKNINNGKWYTMGDVMHPSESHWRVYWRTTEYPDGLYLIKAAITNSSGTYYQAASGEYDVLNTPVSATTGTTNTSTSGGGDGTATTTNSGTSDTSTSQIAGTGGDSTTQSGGDTATTTTQPKTVLVTDSQVSFITLPASLLSGNVILQVTAPSVKEVKFFARNTATNNTNTIGYGTYYGNNIWKFYWNTSSTVQPVVNGTYTLTSLVRFNVDTPNIEKRITGIEVSNKINLTTATTSPETQIAPTSSVATAPTLEPNVRISIPKGSTVAQTVEVIFTTNSTQPIDRIYVYAQSKNSLARNYLGLARKMSSGEWVCTWDTTQTPNGDYNVFGSVTTTYGTFDTSRVGVRVQNVLSTTLTEEQNKSLSLLNETAKAVESEEIPTTEPLTKVLEDTPTEQTSPSSNTTAEYELPPQGPVEYAMPTPPSFTATEEFYRMLSDIQKQIDDAMQKYAHALREGDTKEVDRIRTQLIELRRSSMMHIENADDATPELAQEIESHLDNVLKVSEARVIRQEEIIKTHIGGSALKDNDGDGISDFDEVKLYNTNPFVADTDLDGFPDGVEVLKGFDPTDSTPEVLVAYESPKETGIVRDDVLAIDVVKPFEYEPDSSKPITHALISGKGLPNSFVTLYIFSTPVIVTVKTNQDGGWSYIFDKELDDGEHEVYVGVTDNAGRIVARSNPYAFVKTAEAFTPVEASAGASMETTAEDPTFMTARLLLVVAGIAVVALGLVLILIGLHVDTRHTNQLAVS